jgi:phage shock protein C
VSRKREGSGLAQAVAGGGFAAPIETTEVRELDSSNDTVRKLYRSRKDRVIAGVCGGVAEYFKIDPVWVRIVWVLAIFAKGLGLVAYVLCWLLIPEREWTPAEAVAVEEGASEGAGEGTQGTASRAGAEAGTAGGEAKSSWFPFGSSEPRVVIGGVLIALGCIFGLMAFVPFLSSQAFWAIVLIVLGLALLARR